MPSLRNAVAAAYLRLARHRYWTDEDRFRRGVAERGPRIPPPPLGPGLEIRTAMHDGWTVAEVRPSAPRGTLVHLHGGAYVYDVVPEHWHFAARIARASGWRVVLPLYPLAPEHTAERVVPSVTGLVDRLAASGPLVLSGDSAGGGLALVVAQNRRDAGLPPLDLVLISPWLDVTMRDPRIAEIEPSDPWLARPGGRAAGELYRGSLPATHPWVSPIFGDLGGLGRITVLTGTRDVLNADARRLVPLARAAGTRIRLLEGRGLLHDFPLMPIPEARVGVDAVLAALRG